MNKLKKCPFCNETPRTRVTQGFIKDYIEFSIYCSNCGIKKEKNVHIGSVLQPTDFPDIEIAIDTIIREWNTRFYEEEEETE